MLCRNTNRLHFHIYKYKKKNKPKSKEEVSRAQTAELWFKIQSQASQMKRERVGKGPKVEGKKTRFRGRADRKL